MATTERQLAWRERRIEAWLAEHGEPPSCGCGCGKPVRFDPSGLPYQYVAGHQPKHGLALGPKATKKRQPGEPATAEDRNRGAERMKDRRVAAYLAEHGSPPLCACGCGEEVRFSSKGIPNKWVRGHSLRKRDQWDQVRPGGVRIEDRIPIDKFRAALKKAKAERNLTLREMADLTGVTFGHFKTILYSKRTTHISRDLATHMLRGLAGMGQHARDHHRQDMHRSNKRWQSLDQSQEARQT